MHRAYHEGKAICINSRSISEGYPHAAFSCLNSSISEAESEAERCRHNHSDCEQLNTIRSVENLQRLRIETRNEICRRLLLLKEIF